MNTPLPKSYRKFNAHRFINKFHKGGEALLSEFFRKNLPDSDLAKSDALKTDAVLKFLEQKDDVGKVVTRLLNCAYDLGNHQGAFFLRNAAQSARVVPDPDRKLCPEQLSLKVLINWPDVFEAAYNRLGLAKTDNFSFYAGRHAFAIPEPDALAQSFAAGLQAMKKSHKVVVRSFIEAEMVNFIFYHEKKPSAPLIIHESLAIETLWHRPAQQDFICYNTKTGQVEIEVGSRGEMTAIRKIFAEAAIADAEFFDQPNSTDFLSLDKLLATDFYLAPEVATLKRIALTLAQEEEPSFELVSENVFATLDKNELRAKFQDARVTAATLAIAIPGTTRRTLIDLTAPNKVAFPRSMHTEAIFSRLRALTLLKP